MKIQFRLRETKYEWELSFSKQADWLSRSCNRMPELEDAEDDIVVIEGRIIIRIEGCINGKDTIMVFLVEYWYHYISQITVLYIHLNMIMLLLLTVNRVSTYQPTSPVFSISLVIIVYFISRTTFSVRNPVKIHIV